LLDGYCAFTLLQIKTPRDLGFPGSCGLSSHIEVTSSLSPSGVGSGVGSAGGFFAGSNPVPKTFEGFKRAF